MKKLSDTEAELEMAVLIKKHVLHMIRWRASNSYCVDK